MNGLLEVSVARCECCKNVFTKARGFGTRKAYCRVECWFQASADEYKAACEALGTEPMGAFGPVEEMSVEDWIDLDPDAGYFCEWCQQTHYEPCDLSHEAQAQINELRSTARSYL